MAVATGVAVATGEAAEGSAEGKAGWGYISVIRYRITRTSR